jgi:hypothetical protein
VQGVALGPIHAGATLAGKALLISQLQRFSALASWVQFEKVAKLHSVTPGDLLKIEFGTIDSTEPTTIEAAARKKHGWLPILVVLFLISYALMTMLIVEQGRTIESQRTLIHQLLTDSTELSNLRTKDLEDRLHAAQAQANAIQNSQSHNKPVQTPSTETQANQIQSSQAPLPQAPAKQAPSSQAGAQKTVQNQQAAPNSQVQMPSRTGTDLADSARSLITI